MIKIQERLRYIMFSLIALFLFFAGAISKYSELIFISESYLFAFGIILIFLIFAVIMIFSEGKINKLTFSPIIIVFFFVFILLLFTSVVKYDSIVETYRIASPVLLLIVMINIIRNNNDRKLYSYTLLAFGLFISILSYIKFYHQGFSNIALDSIWGYTNTFAAFLVLEIFLSLGIYLDTKNKNIKRLFSVIPMFFIFLLFLTISRGGYIALCIAAVIFVLCIKDNIRKTFKDVLPILIGATILIIIGSPKNIILANFGKAVILAKFATGISHNSSLWNREHMAVLATKIFLKRPLTGFGLGSFRYTFAMNEWVAEHFRIDPHSLFFKMLAETGIIGTLSFFSIIGYFLLKTIKKIERKNFLYKGLFAGIIGLLFHMCIDVDTYPIMFIVLFYAISLLIPQKFISLKAIHKKIFVVVSIVLAIITLFDLVPKLIASTYAVKGNFKTASQIDRNSSEYYFYLGESVLKSIDSSNEKIRIDNAIEAYKSAYALNKYDYRAPFRIGIVYLFNKNKKSINYLETAEQLYPTNPNVQSWLSVAYCYLLGDTDKAGSYLKEAEKYTWGGLDIKFAKGVYALNVGNKSEANKDFSTITFYRNMYKQFGMSENYSEGIHNLQLKIIEDLKNRTILP
jgi:O-antigen ligase